MAVLSEAPESSRCFITISILRNASRAESRGIRPHIIRKLNYCYGKCYSRMRVARHRAEGAEGAEGEGGCVASASQIVRFT